MSKGHIYFEIQADDSKRAIDFYSQVFAWKFSQIKGLPVPYWTIETGGSRGGIVAAPAKSPRPHAVRTRLSARSRWRISTQPRKRYCSWRASSPCPNSQYPVRVGRVTSWILRGIPSEFLKSMKTPANSRGDIDEHGAGCLPSPMMSCNSHIAYSEPSAILAQLPQVIF